MSLRVKKTSSQPARNTHHQHSRCHSFNSQCTNIVRLVTQSISSKISTTSHHNTSICPHHTTHSHNNIQMDIKHVLADINSSADHKTKTEKYKSLLDDLIKTKDVSHLRLFIDHSIHPCCILSLPSSSSSPNAGSPSLSALYYISVSLIKCSGRRTNSPRDLPYTAPFFCACSPSAGLNKAERHWTLYVGEGAAPRGCF